MALKKITLEEAEKVLKKIREKSYDNEVAHGLEDNLHQNALYTIAKLAEEAEDLTQTVALVGLMGDIASKALSSKNIKFQRWTA